MVAKKRESAFSKFKGQKGLTKDVPTDDKTSAGTSPLAETVVETPTPVTHAPAVAVPANPSPAASPLEIKPKPMEKTIHCRVPDDIFIDITALAYRALEERLATTMPKVSPSTIVRACVEFTLRRFDGNKTEIDSIIDKILNDLSKAKKRQR